MTRTEASIAVRTRLPRVARYSPRTPSASAEPPIYRYATESGIRSWYAASRELPASNMVFKLST